jgi:membrane-associated protein
LDHILHFFGFQDMSHLVSWCGYWGLAAIIFAETGLLAGFFLPGDSLLVTAGLFAVPGHSHPLDIWLMNGILIPAAIIGDAVGFWFGRKTGPALFNKPDSRFFKKKHLLATQAFYEKHGGKTIVIARFMPFARTFAPVVAGVADMPYRRFAVFNITGGVFWISSMTFLGYFLGSQIPDIGKHIEKIIIIVVFLSISPGLYAAFRAWRNAKANPETPS